MRAARLFALAAMTCALVLATSGTRAVAEASDGYVGTAACAGCHAAETRPGAAAPRPRDGGGERPASGPGRLRRRDLHLRQRHLAVLPRDGRYLVSTDGADGRLADFEIPLHVRRLPAAAVPDRLPGRAPAGARHRLGRAAEGSRAGSAGSTSTRARTSTPAKTLPLDRPRPDLELRLRRVSLDQPAQELRAGERQLPDELVRDRRRLQVLPRARRRPRRPGRQDGRVRPGRGRRAHRPLRRAPGRPLGGGPAARQAGAPPARTTAVELGTCGMCHARRTQLREPWRPGRQLLDTHLTSLLEPGLFRGRRQDGGEEYNFQAFRQSKMFSRGVTCSDCHDPHSLQLRAEGNAISPVRRPRPTTPPRTTTTPRARRRGSARRVTCPSAPTWSSTGATTTASASRAPTSRPASA